VRTWLVVTWVVSPSAVAVHVPPVAGNGSIMIDVGAGPPGSSCVQPAPEIDSGGTIVAHAAVPLPKPPCSVPVVHEGWAVIEHGHVHADAAACGSATRSFDVRPAGHGSRLGSNRTRLQPAGIDATQLPVAASTPTPWPASPLPITAPSLPLPASPVGSLPASEARPDPRPSRPRPQPAVAANAAKASGAMTRTQRMATEGSPRRRSSAMAKGGT